MVIVAIYGIYGMAIYTWWTTVVYFARQFCLPLRSDGVLKWNCFDCASSSCRLHKLLLNYCLGCFSKADLTSEYLLHEHFQVKRPLIRALSSQVSTFDLLYVVSDFRTGMSLSYIKSTFPWMIVSKYDSPRNYAHVPFLYNDDSNDWEEVVSCWRPLERPLRGLGARAQVCTCMQTIIIII